MTKDLFIYGSGTLSEIAHYYFESDSPYNVLGFIDQEEIAEHKKELFSKPIFKWQDFCDEFDSRQVDVFVAIGYRKTNKLRQKRYEMVISNGFKCASYVSSRATNMASEIGSNCFILENNVLQPFVKIGNNVTLWSGNHIGHHSEIHDHSFMTSHVVISGKCVIGENTFIGVNSCLRDGITIEHHSVVGAGSIVMNDALPHSVFSPISTQPRQIKRDII